MEVEIPRLLFSTNPLPVEIFFFCLLEDVGDNIAGKSEYAKAGYVYVI